MVETQGDGWRVRRGNLMYLQLLCSCLDVSASSQTLKQPFKGFLSGALLESSGSLLPWVSSSSPSDVCWFSVKRAPVVMTGKLQNQTITA